MFTPPSPNTLLYLEIIDCLQAQLSSLKRKLARKVDKEILASDASDGTEGDMSEGDGGDLSESHHSISADSDEAKTQVDDNETPRSPESSTSKPKHKPKQIKNGKSSPKKREQKNDSPSVSTDQ